MKYRNGEIIIYYKHYLFISLPLIRGVEWTWMVNVDYTITVLLGEDQWTFVNNSIVVYATSACQTGALRFQI